MRKLTFTMVMVLCSTMVIYAHNPKDDDDNLYKKIVELQDTVKAKEKEISKIRKDMAALQEKYNKVSNQLEEEKNSTKKNELKELKKQITQLQKDSADCAGNLEASLKKQADEYEKQLAKLRQQHSKDSADLVAVQQGLGDLKNFRQLWIADMAKSVDEQWMKIPFSQIDIAELEKTHQQCKEFSNADKKIAEAEGKLKILLNDCKIYQQGMTVISSRYNAASVQSALSSVKVVRDHTVDEVKRNELKTLIRKLDDYGVTVEIFQDVIKAIDGKVAGQANQRAAWPLANAEINKQEQESEYISAIKDIPWLESQYNAYYEAIKRDCLNSNPIKEDILSIIP